MGISDLDAWIEKLKDSVLPSEDEIKVLCGKVREILVEEGNVQVVYAPVVVVGDVHGQFYDLLELFKVGETLLLLLALKVRFPDRVALIRGNHESRQVTQVYGFYEECVRKFGSATVWRLCAEIFDCMSLSAVVEQRVFCVHGGLSPGIESLEDIEAIDRKQEVPHEGPMCDLLWSDPEEVEGWTLSPRGAGYLFGEEAVQHFLHVNHLNFIARAHQLVMEGYKQMFQGRVVTVWSAPNYCYRCGNVASIMELDENLERNFKVFEAAPESSRPEKGRVKAPDYFL
ncbi:Serine/threonine-protein phosphatase 4 catalytic subunit [Galdieria sulphuraria]|nr:Serine/threonine-protein phosphatase 4 catalytic subunit [Galdieria sulphuraria]